MHPGLLLVQLHLAFSADFLLSGTNLVRGVLYDVPFIYINITALRHVTAHYH